MSKKKLLCFTLSIIFFISLISFKQIIIKADVINMPKFDVEMSVNPTSVVIGQDVTISGTIYPREFTLNSMPAKPRDIVVVVDRKVASNGDIIPLVEELKSFFKTIKDNYKYEGSRVGIIGYDKNATIYESSNNSLISLKNYSEIEKILNNLKSDVQGDKNKDNKDTNIGEALRKAEYLLHFSENNSEADKIIILIANNKAGARTSYINESDEGNYYTDITKEDYRNDKAQVYEGIDDRSFEYSKKIGETIKKNEDKIFTISYLETEKKKDVTEQLKELHESIIGKSVDNLTENEKSFFVTTDKNGGDIKTIFEEIDKQISQEYEIDDIQMNLEFNEGISLDIGGNIVNLDNIIYKLISNEEEKNNNIYRYAAAPIDFEFKIKASNIGEDQELFSSIDITYTWQGKEIKQNIELNTPIKVTVNEDKSYMGPDIRILEIEPGDSFKLTLNLNQKAVSGIETIEDYKGYRIEITHMTMAEFIGKIEQINGKYDAIVIGRYIDSNLTGPNGTIDYLNIGYNNIFISKDLKNKSWFNDYAYLQNDITNKKAKEIREFIQSGQLVYIDKTIGDNSNNNPDNNNIDWTKLYYHLTNSQGDFLRDNIGSLSNFIRDKEITQLSVDDIVNKYIEQSNNNLNKQVIYANSPEGDTLGTLGDINKRNMNFNITSKNPKNEELTINLYLDINGDGLFKEEEVVKTVNGVNLSNGDYNLQYNIYEEYPQFIGYLDWKIEAIKNNNGYSIPIKSHYDGNITFTRLEGEEKRIINVLQVSPFTRDKLNSTTSAGDAGWNGKQGANLNLAQNTEFKKLLNSAQLSDYDIKIDVISYQDFYNGNYLGPGRESLNKSKYDMIIMGFSDMYPEEDISEEAVNQLKEYVKAGKSLMLTHDTLTYWKAWDGLQNASELMKAFRDISGQSRYIDKLNQGETDFNDKKIVHDVNKPTDDAKKENGSTFVGMYTGVNADTTESNKVYRTNKTVVTSYPFEINENEIPVRETHGQYFQLNLEDEDTVPILNLTERNNETSGNYKNEVSFNNRYDSRNFYYTYSRGNITFSGTGENAREKNEYPVSEMKLFINTIVKAERSANHKPIISGLSEDTATEVSANNDFEFNIVVKDPDKDQVRINSIMVGDEALNSINNLPTAYGDSGTSYSLKISKDKLSEYIDEEITLKIEAEDKRNAISIKEYKIKVVSNAIIVPKTVKKGLVINQEESFTIDLKTENDSNPTSIFVEDNIIAPKIEGIYEIESIRPINDNGGLKLEIKNLVAYQKEKGREINIPLSYTTGGKQKNVIIKIIYDSDYIRIEEPDITAKLNGEKTIEINENNNNNNTITLEYTIEPQSFTSDMLISNKEIGEVIFIVDINQNILSNQKTNIQNGMNNILINKGSYSNLKFGVLGFCDNPLFGVIENYNNGYSGKILDDIDDINNTNPFFTNSVAQEMDRYREVVSNIWNKQNTTNNRDISKSLIMAKELFDKYGDKNVGKAIVLVLGDSINNASQDLLYAVNKIKSSGYKIITLDLSGGRSSNELKEFHKSLGGNIESNNYEGDYFKPSLSDSNYNNAGEDVQKIADRLKGNGGNNGYKITPTFTFDLNDNFEYIQNSNANIKLNSLSGNKLEFVLNNPIEYSYSNMQDEYGEYIYNANQQTISFQVKVKDNKFGELTFGENSNILDTSTYKNYFEYTNFKGTINKKPLETPTVIVKKDEEKVSNLTHGLYNGISDREVSIQENNEDNPSFKIAQGSTVTFGANFTFSGNSIEFNLNIDNKFSTINPSDIKIYKVSKDSSGKATLEDIGTNNKSISTSENNKFKISVKNMTDSSTEILVVYQGKIIDKTASGQELINEIVFSSTSNNVKIVTPNESTGLPILPDLF